MKLIFSEHNTKYNIQRDILECTKLKSESHTEMNDKRKLWNQLISLEQYITGTQKWVKSKLN